MSVVTFPFDYTKTLQAVGILLECEKSRRMSYMRLLKLLYIADREMLAETGQPITGDRPVAMKLGPILCRTYDLIRGQSGRSGEWDQFVHTERYFVELVADPGRGELSKGEAGKLRAVSERHWNMDEWQIADLTHEFGEWKKNFPGGNAVAEIPWEDVLAAQGKGHLGEMVAREEAERRFFDSAFGG